MQQQNSLFQLNKSFLLPLLLSLIILISLVILQLIYSQEIIQKDMQILINFQEFFEIPLMEILMTFTEIILNPSLF